MEDMEWIIWNMFLKEHGKEELNIIMELIGEPFVMILISTWQLPMFFANLSIQDSVPLTGQMLEAYLIAEVMTFLMATKNLLSWMMCLAKEKKKT